MGSGASTASDADIGAMAKAYAPHGIKLKTEADYPKWYRAPGHESVSSKVLTPEMYMKFANIVGPRGYTFDEAIQCGIDTKSGTGAALPDEESYYLWQEFYDKMIEARHGFPAGKEHPTDLDYSKVDASKLPEDLDKYCVSTRIRAARNISGYALPPAASRSERRAVATLAEEALGTLEGELAGKYYDLGSMSKEDEDFLQENHFLFQKPNPKAMISGCGGTRDWPDARGIFHNEAKEFLVWVNEEDQMRVIAMKKGGNVLEVFKLWADGVNGVEKVFTAKGKKFMTDPHLGMFSSCVSNLGTGLRASMMILMGKTYEMIGMEKMDELAKAMSMQVRGANGEHTPPGPGGKVDISNFDRIGKSEVELVQIMVNGICAFVELEKVAEGGDKEATLAKQAELLAAATSS